MSPFDWNMPMNKKHITHPVNALVLALGLISGFAHAADNPLKVGTTAAFAIPLETAVAEAEKQGLKVELVEFTDWIAPNTTLAAGDIDVNYFQHIPFLENANAASGSDLVPFKPGIINNIGLYSKTYKSLEALPTGATVAIARGAAGTSR